MELLKFDSVDISYGDQVAVRGVSFSLCEREILALVGESGSGKSTIVRAAVRLPGCGKVTRGRILFRGRDISSLDESEMRRVRGARIAMAFQDAASSFCPVRTVGEQLYESLAAHGKITKGDVKTRALEAFSKLGLDEAVWDSYPFELSGGMCARVGIAVAMLPRPDVLLADEPTAALDTVSKHEVVAEILRLRERLGTSAVIVTHDFSVARHADRIVVLKDGEIVESGATCEVMGTPASDYTRRLLAAMPRLRRREP